MMQINDTGDKMKKTEIMKKMMEAAKPHLTAEVQTRLAAYIRAMPNAKLLTLVKAHLTGAELPTAIQKELKTQINKGYDAALKNLLA